MVALVHHDDVPGVGIHKRVEVRPERRTVDARDDPGIPKGCITIITGHPLSEMQAQTFEFLMHVTNQTRRCEVEHAELRLAFQKVSKNKSSLNGLAEADFVSNQHSVEIWILEDVTHETCLMTEGRDGMRVKASLRILADQEPCLEASETAPRLGMPVIGVGKACGQFSRGRQGVDT